jgi:hypothetical protein
MDHNHATHHDAENKRDRKHNAVDTQRPPAIARLDEVLHSVQDGTAVRLLDGEGTAGTPGLTV